MNRTARFLAIGAIVALASGNFARPAISQGQPRPNIILIQADDLGYGDLSAYGQAQVPDAGLDRLAREGIRFTQYYSGSTVCAPSRAALMTGLHTGHAWIRGNGEIPLRPEDMTVAMVLREAGYRTAVIGKWGLGSRARRASPTRRASSTRSGSSTIGTPTGSTPITCTATASAWPIDLEQGLRERSVHARSRGVHRARRSASRSSCYLNYTVPHAELRVPGGFAGAAHGTFPARDAVRQRRRPTRGRPARRPTARRSATGRSRRRTRRSPR